MITTLQCAHFLGLMINLAVTSQNLLSKTSFDKKLCTESVPIDAFADSQSSLLCSHFDNKLFSL